MGCVYEKDVVTGYRSIGLELSSDESKGLISLKIDEESYRFLSQSILPVTPSNSPVRRDASLHPISPDCLPVSPDCAQCPFQTAEREFNDA